MNAPAVDQGQKPQKVQSTAHVNSRPGLATPKPILLLSNA
ncbi:MAG: hypothetical protein BWX73_01708 [Lentisphaerae bacterium ADurb.Bin082]|nr:MAG: hypothetical protein BWX73_01708 [Lentisphaerae bacterium ADurb.Bin082]